QVVAIRFAALLGVVFVAVLLDLLRVGRLFAASRPGARKNGLLVVADQRNQSGQGGGVAIPFDRYVQSAGSVDLRAAGVDRVERRFDFGDSRFAFEFGAYEFASFARWSGRFDAAVLLRFPSRRQPGDLISVVVR